MEKSEVYFPSAAELTAPNGYERVIPVVFATNDRYAPYAGVAIESVKQHMSPQNYYRIYVLHTGLSRRHIRTLEALGEEQLAVRCLNVSAFLRTMKTKLPVNDYFTKECYYRILLPEIFSFYPKAVYLDCDLIVRSDIADIIPEDMGDALIAGVRDFCPSYDISRLARDFDLSAEEYINSGVLVFQIQIWNRENTSEKCFEMVRTTPAKKLHYPDQDVINAVCRDRILLLDGSWNFSWGVLFQEAEDYEKYKPLIEKYGESFRILHFACNKKPWNSPQLPYARYFWETAEKSPYYQEIRTLRYVTWLPRKIRGGVRCFRNHGAGYTVRRILYHMGLWKGAEE